MQELVQICPQVEAFPGCRSGLEDGDGGGVEPQWKLTFGHMVKKLCAICV
jgi:hypothetical protein